MNRFTSSIRCLQISLLLLLCGSVVAQPDSRQARQLKAWLKRYPDADANRDGVLTLEEARQYREKVLKKQRAQARRQRPAPSRADVEYGLHARNVFDLWLPETAPAPEAGYPVFVYFHGGGFVAGDKSGFNPTPYLEKGYAVVSGNYRFVDGMEMLSPTPMLDAARAIQFLRTKAKEWKLDSERICVSGSSAGAVITLWIGYHDDLADPDSDDPVARQSTRVKCIVPTNGPTNLDPKWINDNMGGPPHVHGSFPKMFGVPTSRSDRPDVAARIKESSPIAHLSSDDPPTLSIYSGKLAGIPLPESASTGLLIHHPYFGKVLKERLDKLGIPNEFHHSFDPRKPERQQVIFDWLETHLRAEPAE